MKIRIKNRGAQSASVLTVTLMTTAIIGTTLASYLVMTQNQNAAIYRSQTWNSSMAVTEAGVEDGLQLINLFQGNFTSLADLAQWTNNATSDNWTNEALNVYHIKRTIGDSSYDVYVTNYNNAPTVTAYATVPWNFQFTVSCGLPSTMFAAAGTPSSTLSLGRKVTVQTTYDPLFVVAMAALGKIDLNGNNITTDSFDSGDTNYSGSGGSYPSGTLSKTKANGDICTDGALVDSLDIGNADIKGHVKTGPGTNTIEIGPNGSVGDRAWVEGNTSGIEPGYSATDFNVIFPDVTLPSNFSPHTLLPLSGSGTNINGSSYNYAVFTSGDYSISSLSKSIYFGPGVYARIICYGTVNLTGSSDQIHVASGAQVRWFQQGASFSAGGNGLVNDNGTADSFYYFGLTANTSVSFGGNSAFIGGIYAPEAAFTMGGGGNNTLDFIGASVTKTVKMNGKFNFHYDENLRRIGPGRGYIPVSWAEAAVNN